MILLKKHWLDRLAFEQNDPFEKKHRLDKLAFEQNDPFEKKNIGLIG